MCTPAQHGLCTVLSARLCGAHVRMHGAQSGMGCMCPVGRYVLDACSIFSSLVHVAVSYRLEFDPLPNNHEL